MSESQDKIEISSNPSNKRLSLNAKRKDIKKRMAKVRESIKSKRESSEMEIKFEKEMRIQNEKDDDIDGQVNYELGSDINLKEGSQSLIRKNFGTNTTPKIILNSISEELL